MTSTTMSKNSDPIEAGLDRLWSERDRGLQHRRPHGAFSVEGEARLGASRASIVRKRGQCPLRHHYFREFLTTNPCGLVTASIL